ncbi:hypothetical protein CAFE_25380 [Caprobacter fermentans]|uniref:Bypass of forespore C C-terminal domain-containing protein n=1 Tax=Caproicibacter fermentans TaxID=2576756 RepID=A0A6N8I1A1_9FIRM|nr:hypothetical protein [Caproicibacter fermentans]MVB11812.1 hypothetical protein [Caproicibacter fermentans]OCN00762.1 hypothetical protein A7X67_08285 [Clostridium sp. W14A]QNK41698.1 hypothetical protein HCR03_05465 [Caproicibacter fermentans]
MKKTSMLLLCVIALLTVLVVLGLPHWNRQSGSSSAPDSTASSNFTSIEPSSQESSAIIAAASRQNEDLYIVREFDGHIGVFREGDKLPFEEIDIDVSIFPEEDQKLLHDGIQARGTAELTRVIEDYEG